MNNSIATMPLKQYLDFRFSTMDPSPLVSNHILNATNLKVSVSPMPNGRNTEDCRNCLNYGEAHMYSGWCQLHKFVIPNTGYEVVCSNYSNAREGSSLETTRLTTITPGSLYYYSYAVAAQPERFATFQDIDRLYVSGWLCNNDIYRNDKDLLGWFLELPLAGAEIVKPGDRLKLEGVDLAAIGCVRRINLQSFRNGAASKTQGSHERTVIYFPDDVSVCYRYLSGYFNLEQIQAALLKKSGSMHLLRKGFPLFIGVNPNTMQIKLRPDFFGFRHLYGTS